VNRRLKSLLVTGECVAGLARTGSVFLSVESEIPETAKFVTSYFSDSHRSFVVVFEDDSFPEVREGEVLRIEPGPVTSIDSSVISRWLSKLSADSLRLITNMIQCEIEDCSEPETSEVLAAFGLVIEARRRVRINDGPCLPAE
jgi:hypothetical protein